MSQDRLLEVVGGGVGGAGDRGTAPGGSRYQFSHALIQETLAEKLTTIRRVRLHARIAEALEQLYGANAEAYAAELAHHFAEAEAVIGPERLVHYSLLAGKRALAVYAYEEALAHFQRGLTAKGVSSAGAEPAGDAETAALLFGLGRAQVATFYTYQLPAAADTLSRAFEYCAEAGDVTQAVAVAEHPVRTGGGGRTGMGQLITPALRLVPSDSPRAGRLLSRRARL